MEIEVNYDVTLRSMFTLVPYILVRDDMMMMTGFMCNGGTAVSFWGWVHRFGVWTAPCDDDAQMHECTAGDASLSSSTVRGASGNVCNKSHDSSGALMLNTGMHHPNIKVQIGESEEPVMSGSRILSLRSHLHATPLAS